jgi:hypothetical protein
LGLNLGVVEMDLKSAIDQVVIQNSGGVKFIELVVGVFDLMNKIERVTFTSDQIEDAVRNDMPHLAILEYAMEMGDTQRIKMFVYNKLS